MKAFLVEVEFHRLLGRHHARLLHAADKGQRSERTEENGFIAQHLRQRHRTSRCDVSARLNAMANRNDVFWAQSGPYFASLAELTLVTFFQYWNTQRFVDEQPLAVRAGEFAGKKTHLRGADEAGDEFIGRPLEQVDR